MFLTFVLTVLYFSCLPAASSQQQDELQVLFMYDSTSDEYDVDGVRRAIEKAEEHINNDTNLLPEYTLNITEVDSKVTTCMSLHVGRSKQ